MTAQFGTKKEETGEFKLNFLKPWSFMGQKKERMPIELPRQIPQFPARFLNGLLFFQGPNGNAENHTKLMKELQEAQEEAKKSKQENDRLLQQIKSANEEQGLKEKLIQELQEYVYCVLGNIHLLAPIA